MAATAYETFEFIAFPIAHPNREKVGAIFVPETPTDIPAARKPEIRFDYDEERGRKRIRGTPAVAFARLIGCSREYILRRTINRADGLSPKRVETIQFVLFPPGPILGRSSVRTDHGDDYD